MAVKSKYARVISSTRAMLNCCVYAWCVTIEDIVVLSNHHTVLDIYIRFCRLSVAVYSAHAKRLEIFHLSSLTKMCTNDVTSTFMCNAQHNYDV